MTLQIPLSIALNVDASFENYFSDNNVVLLQKIKDIIENKNDKLIICGEKAFGKTHLLQATCIEAEEKELFTMYLPLKEIQQLTPDCFDGLENIDILCIDDVHKIAGLKSWENVLIKFIKNLRSGSRLIFSVDTPNTSIKDINFVQKELKEILLDSFVNMKINPLDEEQKIKAFIMRAQHRGIELDDKVARFLLKRSDYNLSDCFLALLKLDAASLSKQRKLTIPFVKETLEI